MCYGYHIWSKEVLMQAKNDDDLDGGQSSSEVKWGKLCGMATIFGQKKHWCKLRMMMTLMEVKGHQRWNGVNYVVWLPYFVKRSADANWEWWWPLWRSNVIPLWYLVSRWGLGPKVCKHHFGCGNGMNWIKGYYMVVKVKNETFWFSTYSMEMHSLTSSSFIICLWGETFGSRTILLPFMSLFTHKFCPAVSSRMFYLSFSLSKFHPFT